MMNIKSKLALFLAVVLLTPGLSWAHNAYISISGPYDEQVFTTDTLPLNISVEGMIAHNAPPAGANVADSWACVSLDNATPVCEPAPVFGGKPPSSYNYLVPVSINSAGYHTLQASTRKTDGGHAGQSDTITILVVLAPQSCDEVDPPAYANQYLNELNLPSSYATYRGQILKVIAFNHSNGVYGSCTYDYDLVISHVDYLLGDLGL